MSGGVPSGFAAAAKVIADSINTTFGAAVVVLFFFGLSLVMLVSGQGGLESKLRGELIYLLVFSQIGILLLLFLLKIFKPHSLGAPPQPGTEDVSFSNNTIK